MPKEYRVLMQCGSGGEPLVVAFQDGEQVDPNPHYYLYAGSPGDNIHFFIDCVHPTDKWRLICGVLPKNPEPNLALYPLYALTKFKDLGVVDPFASAIDILKLSEDPYPGEQQLLASMYYSLGPDPAKTNAETAELNRLWQAIERIANDDGKKDGLARMQQRLLDGIRAKAAADRASFSGLKPSQYYHDLLESIRALKARVMDAEERAGLLDTLLVEAMEHAAGAEARAEMAARTAAQAVKLAAAAAHPRRSSVVPPAFPAPPVFAPPPAKPAESTPPAAKPAPAVKAAVKIPLAVSTELYSIINMYGQSDASDAGELTRGLLGLVNNGLTPDMELNLSALSVEINLASLAQYFNSDDPSHIMIFNALLNNCAKYIVRDINSGELKIAVFRTANDPDIWRSISSNMKRLDIQNKDVEECCSKQLARIASQSQQAAERAARRAPISQPEVPPTMAPAPLTLMFQVKPADPVRAARRSREHVVREYTMSRLFLNESIADAEAARRLQLTLAPSNIKEMQEAFKKIKRAIISGKVEEGKELSEVKVLLNKNPELKDLYQDDTCLFNVLLARCDRLFNSKTASAAVTIKAYQDLIPLLMPNAETCLTKGVPPDQKNSLDYWMQAFISACKHYNTHAEVATGELSTAIEAPVAEFVSVTLSALQTTISEYFQKHLEAAQDIQSSSFSTDLLLQNPIGLRILLKHMQKKKANKETIFGNLAFLQMMFFAKNSKGKNLQYGLDQAVENNIQKEDERAINSSVADLASLGELLTEYLKYLFLLHKQKKITDEQYQSIVALMTDYFLLSKNPPSNPSNPLYKGLNKNHPPDYYETVQGKKYLKLYLAIMTCHFIELREPMLLCKDVDLHRILLNNDVSDAIIMLAVAGKFDDAARINRNWLLMEQAFKEDDPEYYSSVQKSRGLLIDSLTLHILHAESDFTSLMEKVDALIPRLFTAATADVISNFKADLLFKLLQAGLTAEINKNEAYLDKLKTLLSRYELTIEQVIPAGVVAEEEKAQYIADNYPTLATERRQRIGNR